MHAFTQEALEQTNEPEAERNHAPRTQIDYHVRFRISRPSTFYRILPFYLDLLDGKTMADMARAIGLQRSAASQLLHRWYRYWLSNRLEPIVGNRNPTISQQRHCRDAICDLLVRTVRFDHYAEDGLNLALPQDPAQRLQEQARRYEAFYRGLEAFNEIPPEPDVLRHVHPEALSWLRARQIHKPGDLVAFMQQHRGLPPDAGLGFRAARSLLRAYNAVVRDNGQRLSYADIRESVDRARRTSGSMRPGLNGTALATPLMQKERKELLWEIERLNHGKVAPPTGAHVVSAADMKAFEALSQGETILAAAVRRKAALQAPRPTCHNASAEDIARTRQALRHFLDRRIDRDTAECLWHSISRTGAIQSAQLRSALAKAIVTEKVWFELTREARALIDGILSAKRISIAGALEPRTVRNFLTTQDVMQVLAVTGTQAAAELRGVIFRWMLAHDPNWP